jgi:tetratricopeptide (TPR) repeat protein
MSVDWELARELTEQGKEQAMQGLLREAVRFYDQAIQAADHLPALMNRACAYYHLGDFKRAVRDSSWALEVADRAPMRLVRGMAQARLGKKEASDDLACYLHLGGSHRGLAERTLKELAADASLISN